MRSSEKLTDVRGAPAFADSDGAVAARDASHVHIQRIDISDRTISMIAIAFASLSIGLAILAIVLGQMAEREGKLAREDIRVMSIALARHGIDSDEHAIEKGEGR